MTDLADAFKILRDVRQSLNSLEAVLLTGSKPAPISNAPASIITFTASYYRVDPKRMMDGNERKMEWCQPRNVAMWLMRHAMATRISVEEVGKLFGRGPSSVSASLKAIQNRLDTEPKFKQELDTLLVECKKMLNPDSR